MKNKEYNKRLSEAITWLRFPLIFLIIMLHCYSVQRLEGNHENYFKVLYTFYNWLGETGVPGFFFISGFLFFLSNKSYLQKIKARVHTLLIPYILWNLFMLALYGIAYAIGYPQNINGRSLAAGDRVSVEDQIVLQVGSGQRDANDTLIVTDAVYENMPERGDVNGGEVDNFQVVE